MSPPAQCLFRIINVHQVSVQQLLMNGLLYGKFLKQYLVQNKWPINVSGKGKGRKEGREGKAEQHWGKVENEISLGQSLTIFLLMPPN